VEVIVFPLFQGGPKFHSPFDSHHSLFHDVELTFFWTFDWIDRLETTSLSYSTLTSFDTTCTLVHKNQSVLSFSFPFIISFSGGTLSQLHFNHLLLNTMKITHNLFSFFFTKFRFKVIVATISQMIPTFVTFAGVLFVVYYWFAAFGMHIWAGKMSKDLPELQTLDYIRNEYWHLTYVSFHSLYWVKKREKKEFLIVSLLLYLLRFNNFIEAMSLLFACMTLNNWHSI
jgi:hypothetical protein